jgi:hypothetical protein
MEFIKQEPYDGPTGLAPPLLIEVPLGFERDEWEKLTEVIITLNNNSMR